MQGTVDLPDDRPGDSGVCLILALLVQWQTVFFFVFYAIDQDCR